MKGGGAYFRYLITVTVSGSLVFLIDAEMN